MRAKRSFEGVLEQCLQELGRTGEIEASLRRYPEHADRLRPLLELAQATHRHYRHVPEAPGGLVAGRERFLAAAAQGRQRRTATRSDSRTLSRRLMQPGRLAFRFRLATATLLLIISVALLGGGAVWAARDSLPGDLLYPVKTTTEDLRLALPSSPGRQVDVALQLVERRVDEIQVLVAAARPVPDQSIRRMEQYVERALTQSARADDGELMDLLTQIAVRTRAQAQRLERARDQAPEPARARLAQAAQICRRGAEAAQTGLNDPQAFRRQYRERHDGPESPIEPQRNQEQRQKRDQEQEGPSWPTATVEPPGMPQEPDVDATRPEPKGAPGSGPGATPTAAWPQPTPQGPTTTPGSGDAPHGPRETEKPSVGPAGPDPTTTPRPLPQGPGPTDPPQPTSQRPLATEAPRPGPQGPEPTEVPSPPSSAPGTGPGPSPPTSQPEASGEGPGGK